MFYNIDPWILLLTSTAIFRIQVRFNKLLKNGFCQLFSTKLFFLKMGIHL
jgi:hypothetical protein